LLLIKGFFCCEEDGGDWGVELHAFNNPPFCDITEGEEDSTVIGILAGGTEYGMELIAELDDGLEAPSKNELRFISEAGCFVFLFVFTLI
jgi:hypothetical protein